ncbi:MULTISPECIES: glutamate--cysteine ligase [unclassified Streptomyces]|uniref:carboxylate-amine ligase n=1 Tax=unclassified Streptomyces TaxID=2593676 RepID=UPI001BEB1E10|nr:MULTISPECIES: glutamate--cysteine ligase [unclassified Streptomyces]MBT2405019.1 glutamate--cysteine ligase [Streptomyces sp. ISL-21]MBT2610745.1 glutamate--cysteine ligase [Streptomyces sp. ISL-87]
MVEQVPTLGVEEEFLQADEDTGAVAPCAPAVVKRAQDTLAGQVDGELFPTMVETRTRPVTGLDSLRRELTRLRAGVAEAARESGCQAVASGTPVLPASGEQAGVTDKDRYLRMAGEYGSLVAEHSAEVCGCHIHIGVPDRETAVQLGNHLRPWLPALQALAANSPFHDGRDTGYASWRTMSWALWPGSGPAPLLPDAAAYDALVDALVASGVLLDRGMVYWYTRPSEQWPTLEIRVADVNAEVDTVVLLAALARALAAVLLADIGRGKEPHRVSDPILRAAHWRAARDGLQGCGVDPATGTLRPAGQLVEQLLRFARPGLEAAGDLPAVRDLWRRLRAGGGCGAERQRAAFRRRGELRDVVDLLTLAPGAG